MVLKEEALLRRSDQIAADPGMEIVHFLVRRRRTVLGVFLLVSGAVTAGALWAPRTYKAESSLIVRMGREYVYRPEVGRTEAVRTPSLSEIVNSEVEILSSRDLAELVVAELGVDRLYPEVQDPEIDSDVVRERAVLRFREATLVRPVLESSVIKVSYEHQDPRLAATAVNLLVERFKDKHVEVFGEERSDGLEDQLAARCAELARAEEALAEFKRASGLVDLDRQREVLLGQRLRLENELREREPGALDLAQPPPIVGGDAPALDPAAADVGRAVADAARRLLELRLEESALLRDYTPESRRVQSLRGEVALIEGFLDQARVQASNVEQARRAELVDLDRRIADLYQQEKTLRQLERQLTAAESAEQAIRDRVEDARISKELDREKSINVRVIDQASPPVAPSGLSLGLKIALGAVVGLLAGAALALFQELFRFR